MFGSLTIKMNDTCKQLTKFIMCTILVISAFPFIGLAAIFSIFMDIPHIKIELGADNIVESVHFNMKRIQKEEDDEEEESESESESESEVEEDGSGNEADDENDEESFIQLSKRLSKYLFNEDDNVISTFDVLKKKINRDIEEKGPFDGKGGIIFYPELWRFLGLADGDKLTVDKLWKLLESEYVTLENVEEKEVTVKKENLPATPVRSRSLTPPLAPRRKTMLDTGVLIDKLRASSESNDADITRDLSESFEQATGVQTPSECPPSSS